MERITKGNFLKSPVDDMMFNRRTPPTINSVERDAKINRGEGEVSEVRSGTIDTVGPKEIAKALEVKETTMSRGGA